MSGLSGRTRPGGIPSDDADKSGHPVQRLDKRDALQMPRQTEDIAFRVGQWIELSPPAMDDDDDFRTAAVFHCLAGALLDIDGKARLFQHDCARDTVPKFFQFLFSIVFPTLLAPPVSPDPLSPQFAVPFPAAAKSKGGKGASGNLQICIPLRMTCQQRRSFPCRLPLASDT